MDIEYDIKGIVALEMEILFSDNSYQNWLHWDQCPIYLGQSSKFRMIIP